jgi:hypothetical protein
MITDHAAHAGTADQYNALRASAEQGLASIKERHPQWPQQPLSTGNATVARVKLQAAQHRLRFEKLVPELAEELGIKLTARDTMSSFKLVTQAFFEGEVASVCNVSRCIGVVGNIASIATAIEVFTKQRVR